MLLPINIVTNKGSTKLIQRHAVHAVTLYNQTVTMWFKSTKYNCQKD